MSIEGKQNIGIDFDGTISDYKNGWEGFDIISDPPTDGVKEFIEEVRKTHYVAIISSRALKPEGKAAIEAWLKKYGIEVDMVTAEKVPCEFIVDDRCFCFRGDWNEVIEVFRAEFKPWHKLGHYEAKE